MVARVFCEAHYPSFRGREMILCHRHHDQQLPCLKCENERLRFAAEFVAAGWLGSMGFECKTVGYGPPRTGHNHCLSCWYAEAINVAQNALGQTKGSGKEAK
jgi:hypothetical protein